MSSHRRVVQGPPANCAIPQVASVVATPSSVDSLHGQCGLLDAVILFFVGHQSGLAAALFNVARARGQRSDAFLA